MTDTQAEAQRRAEVDLDHHSPEFREDPYGRFREMRESGCPVAHSDHHEGFWALTDYASVFEASRDDDLFNSYPSVGVPASGMPFPILPIESDPPQTLELRQVTLRQFSPGSADRAREIAVEMAHAAIDEFIERGECDIVGELTTPLPARLILRLLNWDESRYTDWVHWVHTTVHERAHDPDGAAMAGMELFGEITKQLEQRRAEGLGDDLFSDILRGTMDRQPLDDIQITMYGPLLRASHTALSRLTPLATPATSPSPRQPTKAGPLPTARRPCSTSAFRQPWTALTMSRRSRRPSQGRRAQLREA